MPIIDSKEEKRRVYNYFERGGYDEQVFGSNPVLTEDLKILIEAYNRTFIQRLFTRCKSRETLDFWLDQIKVPLLKDAPGLLVDLGNNIHVAKYLKDKGFFEGIAEEDKEYLLKRAERFAGEKYNGLGKEGLEYLRTELALDTSKIQRLFPPIL